MALFTKADISKHSFKYLNSVISDVLEKKKIKLKDSSAVIPITADIKKIKVMLDKKQDPTKLVLTALPWTKIDKAPYSGIGGTGGRNALGKKLADAAELATILSLTKELKTPKDTGDKIFIDNPKIFYDWKMTFDNTKVAVKKIVGNLSGYELLHDATDKTNFKKVITAFCSKAKVAKDSWNPADLFVVKKANMKSVIEELDKIVQTYDVKDGLIDYFNSKIYEYYKDKVLYPISLKQLTSEKANIELTNIPGKSQASAYEITISNFNCNFSENGKEIGVFTFKNEDTGKFIALQIRGFPHGYGVAQTEITSDGTPTGGRLGKISASIVDNVLNEYDHSRIDSISWFGKAPDYFSTFDSKKANEAYKWYTTSIKHNKVKDQNKLSRKEFDALINLARADKEIAANVSVKIQGLNLMYFFINNEKNLSHIMNKMINGAKKISADNGFFIKIY